MEGGTLRVRYGVCDGNVADDATDGGTMDAEEAGDIGCRSTGGKHGDDLGLLLRGELGLTAATASLGTRRAQASLGSFAHHGALEFGKRPKHLHHHATGHIGRTSWRERECQFG